MTKILPQFQRKIIILNELYSFKKNSISLQLNEKEIGEKDFSANFAEIDRGNAIKMNKSTSGFSDKRIRAIRFSWYVFLRAGTACYPTPQRKTWQRVRKFSTTKYSRRKLFVRNGASVRNKEGEESWQDAFDNGVNRSYLGTIANTGRISFTA